MKYAQPCPPNIRLGLNWPLVTNTLAYNATTFKAIVKGFTAPPKYRALTR